MDKNKTLQVSVNGKKTHIDKNQLNRSHYKQPKSMDKNYELAQTELREYNYPASINNQRHKKTVNSSFYHAKPLLISIVAAIAIGSLLGFLMLVMFKGFGNQLPNAIPTVINEEENTEDNSEKDNRGTVNIQGINAYVLQAGVFSEIENADHWARTYEEAGFPTMIWKKDGQFFLLAGISTSRDKGKEDAEQFLAFDFDIFVKEWLTPKKEIHLYESEQQWVESFQTLWNETLRAISEENIMLMDQWEHVLDEASKTKTFQEFATEVKPLLQLESIKTNPLYQQQLLLVSLYQFEQILSQE